MMPDFSALRPEVRPRECLCPEVVYRCAHFNGEVLVVHLVTDESMPAFVVCLHDEGNGPNERGNHELRDFHLVHWGLEQRHAEEVFERSLPAFIAGTL